MYPQGAPSGQQQQQQQQQQSRPWEATGPPPHHHYQSQQPPLAPINTSQARPDRPDMATLHHHQHPYSHHGPPPPDMYRLPAPHSFYPPQQEPYRPPPPPQANVGQSAPRQRTAIACKYCRRRKIRCSGFENSEDGRCSNCIRFSQECVFTPVSAQTQAFVPAQALYGRGRGAPAPQQLYGAYGQRLPEGYPPPPPPQQGYPLPSPGAAQPYPGYPPQPYPPQGYDPAGAGRRRGRDEPHTPTLPPPNPGHQSHLGSRPEDVPPSYAYPDPSGYSGSNSSPASAYPQAPQPYYGSQPPSAGRRTSPGSAYTYDQPQRGSSSPHSSSYSYGQHPPVTSAQTGPTPPPVSRPGMSIHDMVEGSGGNSGERSAADSDMVSALNRTRR